MNVCVRVLFVFVLWKGGPPKEDSLLFFPLLSTNGVFWCFPSAPSLVSVSVFKFLGKCLCSCFSHTENKPASCLCPSCITFGTKFLFTPHWPFGHHLPWSRSRTRTSEKECMQIVHASSWLIGLPWTFLFHTRQESENKGLESCQGMKTGRMQMKRL